MTWLLDTMVVSYFAKADLLSDLSSVASKRPLAVVEEVRDELQSRSQFGAVIKKWLPTSGVRIDSIQVGTPAATLLGRLIKPGIAKGRGEAASIALAASNTELTFVSHEGRASG